MRESNRKYRESEKEELTENKKPLLGFEDVNFEQRREPYNERTRNASNGPKQNLNRQGDERNRR